MSHGSSALAGTQGGHASTASPLGHFASLALFFFIYQDLSTASASLKRPTPARPLHLL